MADEDGGIGFLYSGWCQAALPHKRLPDHEGWQIEGERVGLIVEPGMRMGPDGGKPIPVGVPFGSRARLILLYLQSEALRTGSREVRLGRSLRDWFGRMGIVPAGKNITAVREQAARISLCRLTFHVRSGDKVGLLNQNIVETAMFVSQDDGTQGNLFCETARLSDGFLTSFKNTLCPLRMLHSERSQTTAKRWMCIAGWLTGCTPYRSQDPFHGLPLKHSLVAA